MYKVVVFVLLANLILGDAKSYSQKLQSLELCQILENERDKDVLCTVTFSTNKVDRKRTLIYGNVTVNRRIGPIYISIRTYQLKQDNSKDLIFKVDKVSCTNSAVNRMMKSFRHTIDDKCFVGPGLVTALDGLDTRIFEWLLNKSVTSPGRYAYEFEISTVKGKVSCLYIISHVVPIKK